MANEYIRRKDAVDMCGGYGDLAYMMSTIKPADVAPVVHSRWVLGGYDDMYYVCEKCGHKQSEYYHKPTAKYCPECGAKMDGKE